MIIFVRQQNCGAYPVDADSIGPPIAACLWHSLNDGWRNIASKVPRCAWPTVPSSLCYHRWVPVGRAGSHPAGCTMDDVPNIYVSGEAFMEEAPMTGLMARRNEDIALDLMKFVAMTTGYGKTAAGGVGFQGGVPASKPEEYAAHLLELYGKCLAAVKGN